jgi:hypothetical protein
LVERLRRQAEILEEDEEKIPSVQDVNGQMVRSLGIIHLSWKWKTSTPVHDVTCHVFNSERFDILFGVEYIVAEGMVTFHNTDTDVMAPLISHTKITPC